MTEPVQIMEPFNPEDTLENKHMKANLREVFGKILK